MADEFEQLTPWLWVRQSAFEATNSGMILVGDEAVLIDPGIAPDEIERIRAFVRERGAVVQTILLTHSHWDHMLGVAHFPDAKLVAHSAYAATLAREERGLRQSLGDWEREQSIVRHEPFVLPQPDHTFDDVERFELDGQSFTLIHAPGHHADQFVVYHPGDGVLWAADMLSDLEIPFVEHDLPAYRRTLERLRPLTFTTLIPGHGSWTADRAEIAQRIERDQTYLATVDALVAQCLADGLDLAQTHERCAAIPLHHPAINTQAHHANVEGAWLDHGGAGDPATLGWNIYYPSDSA
jgi:hydroxyacylglutathione hydrolase